MEKSDLKRIQTTLEVVTDNLDDLVNELAPGSRAAKKLVDQLYKTISDVCSELENEIEREEKVKAEKFRMFR